MHVSGISFAYNFKSVPSFKSNITFDIGGSQREGSCKIYYATSDSDEKIYGAQTTVNDLGKYRFQDSDDFIEKIVKKVRTVQENNRSNVQDMGYDASENRVKSMSIFIPSYTIDDFAYYLPNHKNLKNKPLKDLDFSDIRERLIRKGVKIAPDMKFRLMQDAMGTGMAVAKKLYDNDMLEKGKYYTACITGGGCGVANIEMTDDDHVIIKSTGSGYLSDGMNSLMKVSKAGASAPALIRNFCRSFGLNDEMVEDIQSCHKAEFVLKNPITYEKEPKTEKLKTLLLESDKYEVLSENASQYTIGVKKEYLESYDRSRRSAIDKYCWAFARFAIIKKTECSNGLIITGPLARAINKVAKENYNIGISDWVKEHLLSSYNTHELEKMQKTYNFQIICDERFFLDDNTACGQLAHKAEFVAPNRGNWVKLSLNSLKDKSDYNIAA